jgi:glycosyltransferase involved in cell wall biosynthesis
MTVVKPMLRDRRLLVVTESLDVGGTESHLRRLLPRLSASGWEVAVFCLSARGAHADELESKGLEVHSTRKFSVATSLTSRNPVFLVRAARNLLSFMRRWKPAIAHFYLPGPYMIGAPMAILDQTPVKVMSRRSLSHYQQRWPTVAFFERKLHERMDALIGNSRAVVGELLKEGAPENKVRLIYNGIELSERQIDRGETRRELGLNEHALVGVMVANLIQYKGHRDLIRALAKTAGQLEVPWRVLFVGRDEGLRPELEKLAWKAGIAHNIQFLGERSDVSRVLAAADFGLLVSHEEGFSNVILEGMAARLPMIVTDVGGNTDAVENEKTGLVVPAHDPDAIGKAVLRLARDPGLRNRFGAAGKDRVSQRFSMDRCAEAHAELYEELLAKADHRQREQSQPTMAVRAREPKLRQKMPK